MQRTSVTIGDSAPAEFFPGLNNQSMKFIIDGGICGNAAFKTGANFVVAGLGMRVSMAFQNSPGVGVHDKYWMLPGIKKNAVSGFRPDATDREELVAKRRCRRSKHLREGTSILCSQKANECLQRFCLLPVIARRPNQTLQPRQ